MGDSTQQPAPCRGRTGPGSAEADAAHIRLGDRGLRLGAFYAFSLYLCRVAAVTFFEARFFNTRRVPQNGAVVLAGNHQSLVDPFLIGLSLSRRACYLARETLFRVPILGWLIRQYDSVPVPRDSSAPRRSLEVCVKILEKGRVLILFPEGTRSRDGRLQPLKRGICLIRKRTGAPVVPVLVRGAHALWPRSRRLPIPGQVQVVFGDPIHLNMSESESSDAFMTRLAAAFRDLVRETGASELEPLEASVTEAGAAVASPSTIHGEHPVPLKAAAGA